VTMAAGAPSTLGGPTHVTAQHGTRAASPAIGPDRASPNINREERSGRTTMNPKDDNLICFYREAVIAGHDDPAAETKRRFNLSRDYTVRLLNEAIAGCEGQDIRNWVRRMRSPGAVD
jgi:hypothetical protein